MSMFSIVAEFGPDIEDEPEVVIRLKPEVVIRHIQGDFFNWASPEFAKCWLECN